MTAAKRSLAIEQGATWTLGLVWYHPDIVDPTLPGVPYDLTGCTARMQIRRTVRSSTFLVEASTTNGRIILGGATGRIDVTLPDMVTDLLNVTDAGYDLEVVFPDGTVDRVLEGDVTVDLNYTRAGV